MLIGVTGYAQHGKDTVARVLVEDYGFTRVAFADALKNLAYILNPDIAGMGKLQSLVDQVGWDEAKRWPEVRRLLQDLGTGARDIIGPNVWVDAVDLTVRDTLGHVVISDVRFPNEADYVHRWGGKLWRVHRDGFDNGIGTDHPSEANVASLAADTEIYNGDTLETFVGLVRAVARDALGEVPTWARND